jgi:hypothetical protein
MTPNHPRRLHSTSLGAPPRTVHSRTQPFQFLQSHILTRESCPAVARYRPPELGSTLSDVIGPRCACSRTSGVGVEGVWRVTVPIVRYDRSEIIYHGQGWVRTVLVAKIYYRVMQVLSHRVAGSEFGSLFCYHSSSRSVKVFQVTRVALL